MIQLQAKQAQQEKAIMQRNAVVGIWSLARVHGLQKVRAGEGPQIAPATLGESKFLPSGSLHSNEREKKYL